MQAGNDACAVTVPYVLLLLMLHQLSRSRFERYFYELTSVFTAAVFVTLEEYKESSKKGRVLIPRTALAFNVLSLFLWHEIPGASSSRCWPVT